MMYSIVEGLMTQIMTGDNLSVMSGKVGADDKSVKSALDLALPLLLGAVSSKAAKPEGASAIMSSISGMGADNPVDSISGYLNSPEKLQGPDLLSSILGSQLQPIQQSISKSTGLPPAIVGQILGILLPLVIGSLSKSTT
ncbi:MAG TPA: DUF937 domain-containing protein [Methanotrichaceae archaeon]|nr:DUF937 domain-containing protein [Methanotrichaceae archaeon]